MTGSDVGTPHANDSCTTPRLRFQIKRSARPTYLMVLLGLIITLQCQSIPTEAVPKIKLEKFEGLLRRMMLLKRTQRKLSQLPRIALWSILATQKRKLQSARVDILSELLQIHLYHQRYFEALDLEKKFIAFRILCGIEKSVSPDDQEFVKQALPEVSLDAPDSLPMCKNKESVHEQQLKQWQKAVQALNEVEQIAVSDHLILRILKRAYDRSKLYHRQVRDLIFSSESIQNTENQKPNPSLAEDDILTGKIVTYNPEQLVQYVCEDPASPPESETRCPPRILDMFIELRNLEWTYNRIQTLNRLNEFDSNERTLLIPGIQKHIASLSNPLKEELVSKRCFESLSEKLENGDPTLVFIEKAADRDFSWETDERCELMLLQRDVEDIKSTTLRDQYRVQEEELKQKIVGLQTKLGLMYGDSLLKPDSTVRTIQSKIVKLYEYNSMLRINLSLVNQGYTTLSNDSSLNDWYLSSRFGKYTTVILDAIEQKSQKHDAKNASTVKFRFKNSSASLDQQWIISHLYISKSLLMKCIHFPWTNHLGSGPHGDRWSNDASTPSVLQERCSHLAEDVIDVEMMMQKIHWGELTDAPDTLLKSKMKSLASAVFFIHEQIQLYRILQHFRRHIDRSVMNQSEPEVEVAVFQNWLKETIKKAEAVGDELGTKLRAAVSPFPNHKIKVLLSSNLENPPKPSPLPERLLMTDYYIRELTHELHDLAYGHHHLLQHLAMDRWYQYGSLKNLFSYAAFENHRDLITSKKNFEKSIADYRSDLILRMSINERNEFKIEIPEVSDLNNHGAVYVNAVDEVLRLNIKEHPQGAGQVLALQCFDYYLKTHQSYIFLDRIALLRVLWHKSELLHTLTEDLIAWKHVSTEPMPTPNEFKDALQYLCRRYALAEDIIVEKISDCPPYIRQELEHLRLLEYKRARMKFLLNFIGSDTTTQSQVRSMLASKIHHLEETANISHELRVIFENIKSDTYETYEKCAADCTEENQCVPLRDCLNLNTLMETLIRFDSEDGLQLDAVQRQFFEYLVAQFDVEKLVPLFSLHVTWFCEQLVVYNARIVQQIQETRSFLGYTGIPLLPINRPGLLQLAHNMLHLRKALNHQHFVATDSYSFTRFRPPQISLLAFEFSRRKTMLFYESGLERVLRTYLSQPCEASGATLLPAGTDKTKVPLIPVFIESTYSMLNECIARSNSRALSNCASIAEVYLQLYAWLLDFQVFVPSVASYLSKLNQDLEDRIEEQNLLEESTIYYMLPHPIQFSAEGRNPSEQSSTESHDLNVSIAEYSFRFSSQRLKEALESKVQFYRLSMELHGSDAKEAMVEAEKEVAPVASTDLEQTKQGEHIKEPVVQVPPPPHGIVVSPPSEERHYHHTPDPTMEPSTPTATTTTPTATTTTPTATTTTPTATTTTPTATTTTPTQILEREKPPSAWSEGALRIAESNASLPDSEKNTTVQSHTPPIRQTHPSLDHPPLHPHPPLHHHHRAWVVVATLCTIVLMFICICVLSVRRKRRSRGTTYRNFGHAEGSLYNEYPMCGTEQELNPTN